MEKIIQIATMSETERTRSMLWALTDGGEIYFLVLRNNKWMKQSLPTGTEPKQESDPVVDPEVTDESLAAERERHEAAMAIPVSDPEKFTRCEICEKEVPRLPCLAVGESTIC